MLYITNTYVPRPINSGADRDISIHWEKNCSKFIIGDVGLRKNKGPTMKIYRRDFPSFGLDNYALAHCNFC